MSEKTGASFGPGSCPTGEAPNGSSSLSDGDPSRIARTVAEAQVGDLIWRCDPEQSRYDENRKYLGRGVWELATVLEVGRQSIAVGDLKYPNIAGKHDRATGRLRSRSGFSSLPYVRGYAERTEAQWLSDRNKIADAIRACQDIDTLKTVAFALGLPEPPDFSRAPLR